MQNAIDLNIVASWFDNKCPAQRRPAVEAYLSVRPGLSDMISSLLDVTHAPPEKSLLHLRKKVLKRFCRERSDSKKKRK